MDLVKTTGILFVPYFIDSAQMYLMHYINTKEAKEFDSCHNKQHR